MALAQWSPDYSSYTNIAGAQWMPFDAGGGSEGLGPTAAGWYTPGGYDSSQTEGRYVAPQLVDDGKTSYRDLKEAGLWDLKDPNSVAWKYLQAQAGGGDPKTDANALYRGLANAGLMDVAQKDPALVAQNAREMLAGLDPTFVDKFAQATAGNAEGYWASIKDNDAINFSTFKNDMGDAALAYRDMFTQTPLGIAAAAATMGLSAGAGAGAGGAEGGAAAGGTAAGGAGGLEAGASPFLSGLDAGAIAGADFSGVPIASLGGAGAGAGLAGLAEGTPGATMPAATPESPFDLSNQGLFQTGTGQFEQLPMTAGGAGAALGTAGLGAGASIAEGGTASGGATGAGTGAAGTAAGGSALSRILSGEGTLADYLSTGGTLGATALGVYGANQQTQAYTDLANKYMEMGAPYRQKLSDLYANPSSYLGSSEVQVPVQQGTDALARALSIHGNPAGSGTALQELQNYSANQLYGRLGEEKNRLAGFGGLTQFNGAAPGASQAAIGSQGGIYNALGYGLGNLTNPPSSLEQQLRAFRGGLGSLT